MSLSTPRGRVKLSVYHVYVKAASYILMALGVLLIFVHYAGDVSLKFWMRCECHYYVDDVFVAICTTLANSTLNL